MNQKYDVIIAGCGASGMAAAVRSAEKNRKVLVLEKGEREGKKILASGNGRCNLMNSSTPRYYGEPDFALRVLERNPRTEIEKFLRHYGLFLTEEEDGRIYPFSYQASSVLSVLKTALTATGVSVLFRHSVVSAVKKAQQFEIQTEKGDVFVSDRLIIACGGAAQPKLGGSADGYSLLGSMGHTIVPASPALVPLITDRRSISGLSGIRARCRVSLYHNSTCQHTEKGEILFTDYGVSGICIMQCARFAGEEHTYLLIDFLSDAFRNPTDAVCEMKRRQNRFPGMSPLILMNGILNERIAFAVMKQAGMSMREETAGDLSDKDLLHIVQTAYAYRVEITGTKGYDFAQVTAGGAACSEFNPITMESLIVQGLYAAGEVLNVDGDCGGFNLMFALSSGLTAGNAV